MCERMCAWYVHYVGCVVHVYTCGVYLCLRDVLCGTRMPLRGKIVDFPFFLSTTLINKVQIHM